jgi:N-acetylmuramoyl-L-alanine amidase
MSFFKKATFSLVIMLAALFVFAGAAYAEQVGVISGSVVNLRAEPNTTSNVLAKFEKGTGVSVIEGKDGWYKVIHNDLTGWISGDYIIVSDVAIYSGTINASVLNVRSKPDISSDVLTKLKSGVKVNIFEESGEWYRISVGVGKYGWVNKEYVIVRKESASRGAEDTIAELNAALNEKEATGVRQEIVEFAKTLQGIKYVYGGSTTKGFDCSGFVGYVFKHFGITLERSSYDMSRTGTKVNKSDLQPGDVVFFDTNGGLNKVNHVGIYIGNGKFIHASSAVNKRVTINSLSDSFYSKCYMCARNFID